MHETILLAIKEDLETKGFIIERVTLSNNLAATGLRIVLSNDISGYIPTHMVVTVKNNIILVYLFVGRDIISMTRYDLCDYNSLADMYEEIDRRSNGRLRGPAC